MAKTQRLRSAKGRRTVLADLLQSYTKVRKLVQKARATRLSRQGLAKALMMQTSSKDEVVMHEICRRLKQKKRQIQPWGNAAKKDDKMYQALAASTSVRASDDQAGINAFVKESFRCRAICVISARFRRPGFLPSSPVPASRLPYRVYGYSPKKQHVRKHERWCKEYKKWKALPKFWKYKQKLTDSMQKERCSAGAFARLQVLTDAFHRLGESLVELPEASLGSGVHAGSDVMNTQELEMLREELNSRRFFRKLWGSSITLPEMGHLVCELVNIAGNTVASTVLCDSCGDS